MRRAAWPAVTGLALALVTGPAAVAGPAAVESASWTQLRQSLPVGVTPDLQQGQGDGLPVSNGPTGPLAFSAVRFADGAVRSLALTLLDGGTTSTPVVWACPATATWGAGDRQAWDTRPTYDCTTHAVGRVDGTRVSWLLEGDPAVDVVLVPAPDDKAPWSVTFAVPTAQAFGITPVTGFAAPPAEVGAVPPAAGQAASQVGPQALAPLPGTAAPAPQVPAPDPAPQLAALSPGGALLAGHAAADHAWAGRALLALVALLLMVRMAAPSPSLGAPSSLLRRAPATGP